MKFIFLSTNPSALVKKKHGYKTTLIFAGETVAIYAKLTGSLWPMVLPLA